MKKYLEHIHNKPTHMRRTHAMQISLGIVAIVALGWIVALPFRFASLTAAPSGPAVDANFAQTASVVNAQDGSNATLIVATSTTGY
jgi:hypothetical protein